MRPARARSRVRPGRTRGRRRGRRHVEDDPTRSSRVWTVPNLLSMGRLAGVPVFLWLVLGPEADGWALALLMLSGVTDCLDGYLARRLNQTSQLGQILDPVADRLYILAVVIGLALRDIIPWWVAVILPLRDLLLWGLVPAAAHPRLQRAAGALPRQGGDVQPALRLPAAAARRRRRASSRRWPRCSAGRSPGGASACTGGPASSTPTRSSSCCGPPSAGNRTRPTDVTVT